MVVIKIKIKNNMDVLNATELNTKNDSESTFYLCLLYHRQKKSNCINYLNLYLCNLRVCLRLSGNHMSLRTIYQ